MTKNGASTRSIGILDHGFPTFVLPCTPSAFQQVSMYPFSILTDVHVPLRYPVTIHFIMVIY